MSEWSLIRGGNTLESIGQVSASSRGTLLTAGASNVKGSWSELVAVTPRNLAALILTLRCVLEARTAIDLGLGAAGSEQILMPDITLHTVNPFSLYLPIAVPKGVRLAARSQSTSGASQQIIGLAGIANTHLWPRGLATGINVGFASGTTRGVLVDAGAVAHTKGAWSDLTTSLAKPARLLYVQLLMGTSPGGAAERLLDIGIWDGAAYKVLIPDLYTRTTNGAPPTPGAWGPFPVNLPAGVRLGARCQSSTTDAGARTADVTLLALR